MKTRVHKFVSNISQIFFLFRRISLPLPNFSSLNLRGKHLIAIYENFEQFVTNLFIKHAFLK